MQRSDGHVFTKLYIRVDNETGAIDVALETCAYHMHDASVYWERELRGPGAACDFVSRARAMLVVLLGAPTSSGAMFAGALPWYTLTFLPPGGTRCLLGLRPHELVRSLRSRWARKAR